MIPKENKKSNKAQHNFLVCNFFPHQQNEARQSITAIGLTFSLHIHSLWDTRNNSLHKPNPTEPVGYKCLMLQTQVTELYNKIDFNLHCDRCSLEQPLSKVCSATPNYKPSLPILHLSSLTASNKQRNTVAASVQSTHTPNFPQDDPHSF